MRLESEPDVSRADPSEVVDPDAGDLLKAAGAGPDVPEDRRRALQDGGLREEKAPVAMRGFGEDYRLFLCRRCGCQTTTPTTRRRLCADPGGHAPGVDGDDGERGVGLVGPSERPTEGRAIEPCGESRSADRVQRSWKFPQARPLDVDVDTAAGGNPELEDRLAVGGWRGP